MEDKHYEEVASAPKDELVYHTVSSSSPLRPAVVVPPRDWCFCPDGSSGDKILEIALAEQMLELFTLFKRKQASYGSGNISAFGARGCVVRMSDKMERLKRLIWEAKDDPLPDESILDTLQDMANYALICILVLEDKWPT